MCGGVSRGHNRDQPLELWVRTYLLKYGDDHHHNDHDDGNGGDVDESIKFKFSIGIWVGPKSEEDPPLLQVVANIVTSNHRAIVRPANYLHTNNAQTTMMMMMMLMILLVLSEQNYPLHQLNHNQAQEGSASAQEVSSSSTGSSTNQTRPGTWLVL